LPGSLASSAARCCCCPVTTTARPTRRRARRGHPHAPRRFTPVAGAGHWLPRDVPGQVAGRLIAFLAAAPRVPAALPGGR
jgi:hypothetical protein